MVEYKTLFDSFNARNLSFKQVAQSFIMHPKYDVLIENSNSILLGPRGCGKTTLLKMLTHEALFEFCKDSNNKLLTEIPFIAIYIPTDIQWKTEVDHFKKEFSSDPDFAETILNVLVNTNIYASSIFTFISLTQYLSPNTLNNYLSPFCRELIKIFSLPDNTSPTLYSIDQAINFRISEININLKKIRKGHSKTTNLPDYYYEDFLDRLRSACKSFEYYLSDSHESIFEHKAKPYKWALCFDELELAPVELQEQLFQYTRGKDQNFIFKLTSTPLINYYKSKPNLPSPGSDYNPVILWLYDNSQIETWNLFCKKLIERKLERNYGININPEDLFGPSDFETYVKREYPKYKHQINKNVTEEKGLLILQMHELRLKDPTFESYLKKSRISFPSLIPKNRLEDSEIHRKIKPIVYYRNYYLKKSEIDEKFTKRTRKIKNPFCFGWENICKISDGNPRLIIGIVDKFIQTQILKFNYPISTLSVNEQSWILYRISQRYLEIWATHPDAHIETLTDIYSLKNLISQIGKTFSSNIITKDFTPTPCGTFIVDKGINQKLIDLIQLGLYLGAFILLDPSENINLEGIINKRFRLSFVLYPYFGLPLRKEEKTNKLSSILLSFKNNIQQELTL